MVERAGGSLEGGIGRRGDRAGVGGGRSGWGARRGRREVGGRGLFLRGLGVRVGFRRRHLFSFFLGRVGNPAVLFVYEVCKAGGERVRSNILAGMY